MASLARTVVAVSSLSSLFPHRDFLYPFLYNLKHSSFILIEFDSQQNETQTMEQQRLFISPSVATPLPAGQDEAGFYHGKQRKNPVILRDDRGKVSRLIAEPKSMNIFLKTPLLNKNSRYNTGYSDFTKEVQYSLLTNLHIPQS